MIRKIKISTLKKILAHATSIKFSNPVKNVSNGFYTKFLSHIITSFLLLKYNKLQKKFIDISSLESLFRVALETYITYNYIFGSQNKESLKTFRYQAWLRNGLKDRSKLPTIDLESEQKLKEEEKHIALLTNDLEQSEHYLGLSPGEKKNFKEKGTWMFGSWENHLNNIGFKKTFSKAFYQFSSFSVHSNSVELIQQLNISYKIKMEHLESIESRIYILCSFFTLDYIDSADVNIKTCLEQSEYENFYFWYSMGKEDRDEQ